MGIIQSKIASGTCKLYVDFRNGTASDLSGNDNNGTVTGDPVFNKDGLQFDGDGDYTNHGDPAELNFGTADFTVAYLIKTNNAAAEEVISKRNGVTNVIGFIAGVSGTGKAFTEIDDGAGNEINLTGTVDITDGVTHLVVMTYDRDGDVTAYVDGIKDNDVSIASVGTITNSGVDFLIGRNENGTRQYSGSILAVAAFNELLTATEAAQLTGELSAQKFSNVVTQQTHTNELTDNNENLVGIWRMNPNGDTVPDDYTGAYPLVKYGSVPQSNTELIGDSLLLDGGTGNYMAIADNVNLSFGDASTDNPFSISMWFRFVATANQYIVSKNVSTVNNGEYVIYTNASGYLACRVIDNSGPYYGGRYYTFDLSSVAGKWCHIVMTYDGAGGANPESGIKLYLDGVQVDNGSLSSGGASYVAMENTATDVRLGRLATLYTTGEYGELAIHNEEITQAQVDKNYERGASQIQFKTDWGAYATEQNVTDGFIGNTPWQRSSGTWKISTDAIDGNVVKVLENVSAGIAYSKIKELFMDSTEASFGTWEFWLYKGADANATFLQFMADEIGNISATGQDGYNLKIDGNERVLLQESTNGSAATLFQTATAYVTHSTWYGFKITRRFDGLFTVYIKGGAYGDSWTLVNTSTDITTVGSSYIIFDFDAGDKLAIADDKGGHSFIKSLGVI